MQKVNNFSRYPTNGRILSDYRLSNFKPDTPGDLVLLQMVEGMINRKEFSEVEGCPLDDWYDEKNTNTRKLWARDLVKGNYPENNYPILRRVYNLQTRTFGTKIITKNYDLRPQINFAPDHVITAHMLEIDGREKIEAELKRIFS